MPAARTVRHKELNLTQLRMYCEFLRRRSFADAARALGVSYTAVWQQVRALERHFGVALLRRDGRVWRPTEDGEALLDLIGPALGSFDGLAEAFRQLRPGLPRTLSVIASVGTMLGELAGPVAEFSRSRPHTLVRLRVLTDMDQVAAELLSGAADLAVLPHSMASRTVLRRSLRQDRLASRPAVLVTPTDHPLASRRRVSLGDVAAWPLVQLTPDFSWRRAVDDAFRRAGLADRVRVALEVNLTRAAYDFVRRGLGVALVPQAREVDAAEGLHVRDVRRLVPAEEIYLLRPAGAGRPQAREFAEVLERSCVGG